MQGDPFVDESWPEKLDCERFIERFHGSDLWAEQLREVRHGHQVFRALGTPSRSHRDLPYDVDPHDLGQTGWGMICAAEQAAKIEVLLRRLLDRREEQARSRFRKDLYHEAPESARTFLSFRHGVSPGPCDPDRVPYYLLLVGDPETIPFEFQYHLGLSHAVGRLWFDDPEDFECYADHVVAAETERVSAKKRVTLFSVDDGGDSTRWLDRYLVRPLEERLPATAPQWDVRVCRGEQADKPGLGRLLGGEETPALLLAACHGRQMAAGHPLQEDLQGGLVCQSSTAGGDPAFYGRDLSTNARLGGQIAFLFACYGAGTPVADNFVFDQQQLDLDQPLEPEPIAMRSFLARFPQAMLRQGALAVVGHVDRGWTLSFRWWHQGKAISSVGSLEDSLKRLLAGHRLGESLLPLRRRYLEIAAQLLDPMELYLLKRKVDMNEMSRLLVAHHDSRNFIILGDPAVYLRGNPDPEGSGHE